MGSDELSGGAGPTSLGRADFSRIRAFDYRPPAIIAKAVSGPGAGLRRATEIADVRKFLARLAARALMSYHRPMPKRPSWRATR
jgi:hypothetical protein